MVKKKKNKRNKTTVPTDFKRKEEHINIFTRVNLRIWIK